MQIASQSHELEATMAELLTSRRFPRKWYQSDATRYLFGVIIAFLGYLSIYLFGFRPPLLLSLVSVGLVMLGVLADAVTTYRAFAIKNRYESQGLEFAVREANPLMPSNPTPRDIFLGKPNYVALVLLVVTFFVPLAGWGIAGAAFAVSLNNHHSRQQSMYELGLFEQMTIKG